MGVARGDLDGDGRPDLAVTNFFGESTTFYQNLGEGLFTDRTAAVGLAAPSRYRLGFGIAFLDADDDGRLDLLTVNGHIADERPEIPYAMPAQLMLGGANGRLADVSAAAGPPFQVPRLGRGLAVGDLDDDGRVDAIVVGHEGPVAYFHNNGLGGYSITIRLEGTTSNRDAVGARVTVAAGGRRQVADRFGGGSYQSASDPRLHFGLGTAKRVDAVEVRWPSGRVDRYQGLPADAAYLIREGEAAPRASGRRARSSDSAGASPTDRATSAHSGG
jgi:enediyne biosynthesis protein E4